MLDETAQPQAEETANQPDDIMAAETGGETVADTQGGTDTPFLTVRYNKELKPLSKEAAVEYAQKGLNYDKISARLKEADEKLGVFENSGIDEAAKAYADKHGIPIDDVLKRLQVSLDTHTDKQARINDQLKDFAARNPGVDPARLPRDVVDAWRSGVPLGEAYAAHEFRRQTLALEKELETAKANQRNAAASMGRAESSGRTYFKPLSEETVKTMTAQELEKNHHRIWAMLTGTK